MAQNLINGVAQATKLILHPCRRASRVADMPTGNVAHAHKENPRPNSHNHPAMRQKDDNHLDQVSKGGAIFDHLRLASAFQ